MELPIRMLLVVVVLMFTVAMGYNALDAYLTIEEEATALKAASEILLKARMSGMGGTGARESSEFVIKTGSKLTLRNEDFNGSTNGIVDIELSEGSRLLRVLPLPVWDSETLPSGDEDLMKMKKVFLSGDHRITLTHIALPASANFSSTGLLIIR